MTGGNTLGHIWCSKRLQTGQKIDKIEQRGVMPSESRVLGGKIAESVGRMMQKPTFEKGEFWQLVRVAM